MIPSEFSKEMLLTFDSRHFCIAVDFSRHERRRHIGRSIIFAPHVLPTKGVMNEFAERNTL